jgi:putative hydroxymethylpyrimidine transport system substrate-binding protein
MRLRQIVPPPPAGRTSRARPWRARRPWRADRPWRAAAVAVLAGSGLAGCGEVSNTIHPGQSTADEVTIVLAGQPNALYAGIYEAQARGYFRQSDLNVHILVPSAGQNPVDMVHTGQALFAVASEPTIFLHRNTGQPVVGVGAIVHGPLSAITVPVPKPGPSGGSAVTTQTTTTATTTPATATTAARSGAHTKTTATTNPQTSTTPQTTTTITEPDSVIWPSQLHELLSKPRAPTYDGMVLVVRKSSIVDDAGPLRRFVQTVARGYRAARANPPRAVDDLVKAVPSLASEKALQLSLLNAAMPYIFPPHAKVWGWQREAEWNTFGTWMLQHNLLSNPNAITDASTNELLQGQGV